jgi:hypothetical protein
MLRFLWTNITDDSQKVATMLKKTRVLTFHNMRRECEKGNRAAWRAFLSDYTPVVFQLLDVYLPSASNHRKELWREALRALSANNFEHLRSMSHQAEREFLVDLRMFILERGIAKLDARVDTPGVLKPTPEAVGTLLQGLPLTHQEILFLKLAGYSDSTLEKLLRITPTVAQKGLERLSPDYPIALQQQQDKSLWPAAWWAVLRHARDAKKEDCPPLHQFVRIHDGQVSWYEKEPVEQHIASCVHCLERWTSLREVAYWRLEAKPVTPAELEELLSCLPIEPSSSAKKSFLRRVFS